MSPGTTRAEHAAAFLSAVEVTWDLACAEQVRDAWAQESSCAGMTVGGLANHLINQAVNTALLLGRPPQPEPPIALLDHYHRAAWVSASPDDDVNVAIRDGDNARAEAGRDVVLARAREAIDRLPAALGAQREPDTVLIPWQGWALSTQDFLTTRMMEMVVHGDDLASSVGLETPQYGEAVLGPVLGLLTGVAVRRHGEAAVVRALSRPQRAPATVSAF
ncbi:maleylpyruvate isomerase N-terminal domain-containing protein [Pedococcus sp. 5OH_020]|uniref:maleylpyruvate isomerase N-terminal domain-containing protein n=1 Tax=Pedococcus sp. 5OH_020 TaxID=2989814 RepID=UPI0022E9DE84|nr:maleylpyruvate isomerase N-terminal domain-containing protein [Pedococcus sp. 5OH_020]